MEKETGAEMNNMGRAWRECRRWQRIEELSMSCMRASAPLGAISHKREEYHPIDDTRRI